MINIHKDKILSVLRNDCFDAGMDHIGMEYVVNMFNECDVKDISKMITSLIEKYEYPSVIGDLIRLLGRLDYSVIEKIGYEITRKALKSESIHIRDAAVTTMESWAFNNGWNGEKYWILKDLMQYNETVPWLSKYRDKIVESIKKIQKTRLDKYPDITDLRKESNGDTRLLYHLGFWDGPHTGIMVWHGKKVYFSSLDDDTELVPLTEEELKESIDRFDSNGWGAIKKESMWWRFDDINHRLFEVYEIPDDILEAIEFNHVVFRKYVGIHTDYDENGERYHGPGYLRDYSEHGKFYNDPNAKKDYKLNLKECKIVGQFKY